MNTMKVNTHFKKLYFALLTLLPLLLLSEQSAADWQLKKDVDGIRVYTQEIEGSEFKEFKGIITLQNSIDSVMAVLMDIDSYPEWFYRCKQAKIIKQINSNERQVYQQSALPWPVKDRDIVYHSRQIQDKEGGSILIKFEAISDDSISTAGVRIERSKGSYKIEHLETGETKVTWQSFTDPAGKLPQWLTNAMVTDLPYKSLSALRKQLSLSKYQLGNL